MPAVLVDTNVLVYLHDRGEFGKQARAFEVLDRLWSSGAGVLSVQCLSEFYNVATSGRRPILTAEQASGEVDELVRSWPILNLTPAIVLEAVRGARAHRLAYWDALLWATARLNQIPAIFSEDFSSGTVLDGIRFVNPFAKEFDLESWA